MLPRLLAFFATLTIATAAAAGDVAEFRPIGFSPEGDVFAFEEFGVQDGSGFPYANRYYIDTVTDTFLPGTPVRVLLKDEGKTLAEARKQAALQAAEIENTSGAGIDPGSFAAFAPPTERGNNPAFLRYQTFAGYPGKASSVELSQSPLTPPPGCADLGQPIQGFKLTMTELDGRPVEIVLHADDAIPQSRKCPLSYALAGALAHRNDDGSTTHAVLVLVRSVGFEGPNGRYLAVTRRID